MTRGYIIILKYKLNLIKIVGFRYQYLLVKIIRESKKIKELLKGLSKKNARKMLKENYKARIEIMKMEQRLNRLEYERKRQDQKDKAELKTTFLKIPYLKNYVRNYVKAQSKTIRCGKPGDLNMIIKDQILSTIDQIVNKVRYEGNKLDNHQIDLLKSYCIKKIHLNKENIERQFRLEKEFPLILRSIQESDILKAFDKLVNIREEAIEHGLKEIIEKAQNLISTIGSIKQEEFEKSFTSIKKVIYKSKDSSTLKELENIVDEATYYELNKIKKKVNDFLFTYKTEKQNDLEKKLILIGKLIQTLKLSKALNELDNIIRQAKSYNMGEILNKAQKKVDLCKIYEIYSSFIKNLPSLYNEISFESIIIKSKTHIDREELIFLIENMILQREINARIKGNSLVFVEDKPLVMTQRKKEMLPRLLKSEDIEILRGGDWKIEGNQSENENQNIVKEAHQKFNEGQWDNSKNLFNKSKEICTEQGWNDGVRYAEKMILECDKQKRKEREDKERKEKEAEELNSIPNLQNLVRKFIYTQFRDIEKSLSGIYSTQVDSFFHNTLKNKIPLFYKAMESLGHALTSYQESFIFDMIFSESEPIREDLFKLLKTGEEEDKIRKEREEARRQIEEQRQITVEAFGEEITDIKLVEKVEELKTTGEEIDDLLKVYEDWEYGGKWKKN